MFLPSFLYAGACRLAEKDALKGSHLAEENVLPAGDNDFPSIWK